jgi:predicted amidohydrolase YtcJ
MNDKYKTESKNTFLYATDEEIESNFKRAIDKNFQFCIKTVGDKAVNTNLNIIEKVIKEKNPKDHRTILEFVEFVQPNDISRFGSLNVIPSVRPEFTIENLENIAEYISLNNAANLGMWNSLLQSSKYIVSGTNFPYSNYISPISLIHILVNRQPVDTANSKIQNMNQKLSLIDAIKSFTVYAAFAGFEEKTTGTLEKDKYADFIVLSDDIFTIDSKIIKNIQILKTIINGKVVFSK